MSHMLTRIRREERYGPMLRRWRHARPYAVATVYAALIVLSVAAGHTLEMRWAAQDATAQHLAGTGVLVIPGDVGGVRSFWR